MRYRGIAVLRSRTSACGTSHQTNVQVQPEDCTIGERLEVNVWTNGFVARINAAYEPSTEQGSMVRPG